MIKRWPLILFLAINALALQNQAAEYSRQDYFGQPVYKENGELHHVEENASQTHSKDQYVLIRVKNIQVRSKEEGRIRVAVWDSSDNFTKEGVNPFRGCSHVAKDAVGDEMIFKIGGLSPGKNYAFFAHFDQNNDGTVTKNWLGIPTEPYMFTNAANQGKGPGLTREGFGPPQFKNTLVSYIGPGQEIHLSF